MRVTIPNILTVGRVLAAPLAPLALTLIEGDAGRIAAFAIFALAGVTDFLDGWLARRLGQESAFGRMLDPIADKAMVALSGAALVGLYGLDILVVAPVAVILLREVMVSGLREYLKGAAVLSVTRLAKWKTAVQMIAIGALLLGDAAGPGVTAAGLAALWLAAALTAVTGWDYFARGLAYIQTEEDGR